MTVRGFVVFLHVASAVGLFTVVGIEWVSLRGLGRSLTYEQARDWSGLGRLLMLIGLPATLVALASGIYLATTEGLWSVSWAFVAVPAYLGVMVAGGIAGPRRNRADTALRTGAGSLPGELRRQVRHPVLIASWRFRTALLVGILFIMTARPSWAVWAIVSAAALGIIWSVPAWREGS